MPDATENQPLPRPLPSRFSKKSGRPYSVERLLDSHIIGVQVNNETVYDPEKRTGFYQEGIRGKERNYAVFRPFGEVGAKIFFHGKDLFTPENAQKFYGDYEHQAELINKAAIDRAAHAFATDTLHERLPGFAKGDIAMMVSLQIEMIKDHYPQIDLSALGELPTDLAGFQSYFTKVIGLLAKEGISVEKLYEESQNNPAKFAPTILRKLAVEMPARVNAYLAEPAVNLHETQTKAHFAEELKTYMANHEWDWEILDNFKAAAANIAPLPAELPSILKKGARLRAEHALLKLAKEIHNPYDPRIEMIERTMARIMVDAVQPKTIQYIINNTGRGKCGILFSDDSTLEGLEDHVHPLLSRYAGAYKPPLPQSQNFDDFIMVSSHGLDHRRLAWILRHECEHKIDLDKGIYFSANYKEQLPSMIASDIATLNEVQAFILKTDTASSAEDVERLLNLGRRRGIKASIEKLGELKSGLLMEFRHIRERLAIFAPNTDKTGAENPTPYTEMGSQWLEIPAIMEELKGQYGRTFIAQLLPQLAEATKTHRNELFASTLKPQTVRQ